MRFKHGHLSNIAVEANGASPVAVGKPCFHLSLENVATAVSEPDGHEQLADLLRAHDAGEALPGDALARVMEALRVFVGAGQLHEQLRQFAQHAGLAEAGAGDSPSLPFPWRGAAPNLPANARGTTTLEAVRNLHCRTLHVQANMTKLGAALRETMGIVVSMRKAAAARAEAQKRLAPGEELPAVEAGRRQLANAFG